MLETDYQNCPDTDLGWSNATVALRTRGEKHSCSAEWVNYFPLSGLAAGCPDSFPGPPILGKWVSGIPSSRKLRRHKKSRGKYPRLFLITLA